MPPPARRGGTDRPFLHLVSAGSAVTAPSHPDSKVRINDKARKAFFVQDYTGRASIDGGTITELGRLTAGMHGQLPGFEVKQVNYSEMEPGAIKAFHMHHRQTDVWYVPPSDKMLLVPVSYTHL